MKKIAKQTGKSEREIAEILKKAGVTAIKFDDAIYKRAGLNPIPLNLSPAMLNVLRATIEKTVGLMSNLTKTTALTAQQSFIRAADLAHQQVVAGAMSYDQAIRAAIKKAASDGLEVIDYATGHKDSLDVAMRRTVLTGVAQTANQLQINRADEVGSNLVAVSAHIGARNRGTGIANHEAWQGKVYMRVGSSKKYPNFVETTGYGTGEGLGGWNCRHSFYPFFEGLSENAYSKQDLRDFKKDERTYQDEELSVYEATQKQRYIERQIRLWKRQELALESAKLDASKEAAKVVEWQKAMRDFIKQTKLSRQYVRERI